MRFAFVRAWKDAVRPVCGSKPEQGILLSCPPASSAACALGTMEPADIGTLRFGNTFWKNGGVPLAILHDRIVTRKIRNVAVRCDSGVGPLQGNS
jgi:hypothetical protein